MLIPVTPLIVVAPAVFPPVGPPGVAVPIGIGILPGLVPSRLVVVAVDLTSEVATQVAGVTESAAVDGEDIITFAKINRAAFDAD